MLGDRQHGGAVERLKSAPAADEKTGARRIRDGTGGDAVKAQRMVTLRPAVGYPEELDLYGEVYQMEGLLRRADLECLGLARDVRGLLDRTGVEVLLVLVHAYERGAGGGVTYRRLLATHSPDGAVGVPVLWEVIE